MLIEGIVISVVFVVGLVVLFLINRPKSVVSRLEVKFAAPMPAVKPTRASTTVQFKEQRKATVSRAYEVPYGQDDFVHDTGPQDLGVMSAIAAAAVTVVVADAVYDSFSHSAIDSAPAYEYSSPTPSSYSDSSCSSSSSSSWGGDSSSSSSYSDSSSSSSSSCD